MTLAKLALFQSKLTDMHKLAVRLWPMSGSQYVAWQIAVLERIDKCLCWFIAPQMTRIREHGPLLEYSTNLNLPKEVMEGYCLACLFEVMQVERKVLLAKYECKTKGMLLSTAWPHCLGWSKTATWTWSERSMTSR